MKKILLSVCLLFLGILLVTGKNYVVPWLTISGAPPYGEAENEVPEIGSPEWLLNWKRPEGPARVGLQIGHWKNEEVPEELKNLLGNTGATGGGKDEWEVNMAIAQATARVLKDQGVTVDILPTTIPEGYWADVFVAIHADGNPSHKVAGYKVASPWRDATKRAQDLVSEIEKEYGLATELTKDPNVSKNMRGYYAFSWWKYNHAIHPMTTAVIIETGFLTNPGDRKIIVDKPNIAAKGLASGIIAYLRSQNLLSRSKD